MLQELIIFQLEWGPTVDELMALLDTFAGQPLKKFLLIHLEGGSTPEVFRHIAKSFPQLRDLTLTAGPFLESWSGDVVRFALSILGGTSLTLPTGSLWQCPSRVEIIGTLWMELLQ